MKGKQMSAILAILLMLSGALFVPKSFAVTPADAVQSNPLSIVWSNPPHHVCETFFVYVDVINVTNLFAFQVGFYFASPYLGVMNVTEGGFLSQNGAHSTLAFPGSIDNATGTVTAYGWTLQDTTKAKTGSGHLIKIGMHIEGPLPYSDGYPGGAITMIDLTDTDMDPCETILIFNDGVTEIPVNNYYDGTFTLYVVPANPICCFTFTPAAPYAGDPVTFDGSCSTKGWDGVNWVDIVNYHWDFGDGNITNTAGPGVDHSYAAAGSYDVYLVVTDADGRNSTNDCHLTVPVFERPVGCELDLQSQRWRYIDPDLYFDDPFYGKGPDQPSDSFRPGDMVELWAKTFYNGDAVQDQLVAFEVVDNNGVNILAGTALSDANGWANYLFRIPWPCTGVEDEFGVWCAIAKWSVGNMGGKPWGKTQNDTMCFHVSWGLEIVDKEEDKTEYYKLEEVTVKVWIENQYMIPINATVTVTIYDDLMVPLGKAVIEDYVFLPMSPWSQPKVTMVTMPPIVIPKWAYAGIGYAKADVFTRLPFKCGTAFCPEVVNQFVIKAIPPTWEPPGDP